MVVEIKPELEQFVREQVAAGRFASAAEMVEAGLSRLVDRMDDTLTDEDLEAIEEAEQDIAAGNVVDIKTLRTEYFGEGLAVG